jgi:hypothetical protein
VEIADDLSSPAKILLQYRGNPLPFQLDDDYGLSISQQEYYVPTFSNLPC